MTKQEIDQLVEGIFAAVKVYVQDEFAVRFDGYARGTDERLKSLVLAKGEKGDPGRDGKDGIGRDGAAALDGKDGKDGRDGEKGIDGRQGEKGATGERGEKGDAGVKGDPGESGKSGDRGEPGAKGEKGDAGLNGKDGAPGTNGQKGADGLNGRDGVDGVSGKDADAAVITAAVLDRVTKAFDEIPLPKDGKDGAAGRDGEHGRDGIDGKDGAPGPEGQRGADGINGRDGAPGVEGQKGVDGINGRDGAPGTQGDKGIDGRSVTIDEVRPIFEGEVAKWALEFERRATEIMQKAIERIPVPIDGKDGRDGADALGIEHISARKSGDRSIEFLFKNKDIEKRFEFAFPVALDAGVYESGRKDYEAGDGTTFGGSWWIAQIDRPTSAPGKVPGEWRLAVKRGRDGTDAK